MSFCASRSVRAGRGPAVLAFAIVLALTADHSASAQSPASADAPNLGAGFVPGANPASSSFGPSSASDASGIGGSSSGVAGGAAPSAIGKWVSNLNPMKWKRPEFKMPSFGDLMPGQSEQDRIIQRKDGLVSEVGASAKNSWQRTKEAFNPMKVLPAGNRTPSQGSAGSEKPGFFKRLFTPPPPPQAATVNDFLKQDRIQP